MQEAFPSRGRLGFSMKPVIWGALIVLSISLSGCSDGVAPGVVRTEAGSSQSNSATSVSPPTGEVFEVDVVEFIDGSGVAPTFPQLWIFNADGKLISTERSFRINEPLHLETGEMGPVAGDAERIGSYLARRDVDFDRWKKCGFDYCVVKLVPDASMVERCEGCDRMQSSLDQYFLAQGAAAVQHTVLLTNRIPAEERLKRK